MVIIIIFFFAVEPKRNSSFQRLDRTVGNSTRAWCCAGMSLQFLTIYNPDLDPSEENVADQILFYYGRDEQDADMDSKLRNIGLIQGVVELARGFADGEPLNYLETTKYLIVVSQLEKTQNYWIAASVEIMDEIGAVDQDHISPPEILKSDLISAYNRWRLHFGPIDEYLSLNTRVGLVQELDPWWKAFCQSWICTLNGAGARNYFYDYILTGKGHLNQPTVDAIESVIARDPDLLDMMIITQGAENIEHDGCVYQGLGSLDTNTLSSLVDWAQECCRCGRNTSAAFLEASGFVNHFKETDTALSQVPPDEPVTDSNLAMMPMLKGAFSSMAHVSQAAFDQVVGIGSGIGSKLTALSGTSQTVVKGDLEESAPSDDLTESRFLVGYSGKLVEPGEESPVEEQALDNSLTTGYQNTTITKKILNLKMRQYNEDAAYDDNTDSLVHFETMAARVVIYLRKPFVFLLFYPLETQSIQEKQHYQALHLRLASLTEPIFSDLNTMVSVSSKSPKFYYLVADSNTNTMLSSIPYIPAEKPPDYLTDESDKEAYVIGRQEILHVHQSVISVLTNTYAYENEKFIRTPRNWWVYWSRLSDNRVALFARKLGRKNNGKAAGILSAVGHDAKAWLDDYKYYGRV